MSLNVFHDTDQSWNSNILKYNWSMSHLFFWFPYNVWLQGTLFSYQATEIILRFADSDYPFGNFKLFLSRQRYWNF